ncbi:nedd4-binding protein 1 [Plakobranchus ocellatus]|uniref:Nedd4-binding protein 1 n=1 Tax=Plakobranchus ocellatus TaxID=259542 RepID=A0AAV4C156_9GAST|nr:nedd4-binding protein 1 [Plakobranchus ocellatus]
MAAKSGGVATSEFVVDKNLAHIVKNQLAHVKKLFGVTVNPGKSEHNQQWITVRGPKDHVTSAKDYILALVNPEVSASLKDIWGNPLFTEEKHLEIERCSGAVLARCEEDGKLVLNGTEFSVTVAMSLIDEIFSKQALDVFDDQPTSEEEMLDEPDGNDNDDDDDRDCIIVEGRQERASLQADSVRFNSANPHMDRLNKMFNEQLSSALKASKADENIANSLPKSGSRGRGRPQQSHKSGVGTNAVQLTSHGKEQQAYLRKLALDLRHNKADVEAALAQFDMNEIIKPADFIAKVVSEKTLKNVERGVPATSANKTASENFGSKRLGFDPNASVICLDDSDEEETMVMRTFEQDGGQRISSTSNNTIVLSSEDEVDNHSPVSKASRRSKQNLSGSERQGIASDVSDGATRASSGTNGAWRHPPLFQGGANNAPNVGRGVAMFQGGANNAPNAGRSMAMFQGGANNAPNAGRGMAMFQGGANNAPNAGRGAANNTSNSSSNAGRGMAMFQGAANNTSNSSSNAGRGMAMIQDSANNTSSSSNNAGRGMAMFQDGAGADNSSPETEPYSPTADQLRQEYVLAAMKASSAPKEAKRGLRYIVIDGSNVAWSHGNNTIFSVPGIDICIKYFLSRGHKQITAFVPESRRYTQQVSVAGRNLLHDLNKAGFVKFTPARRVGKQVIASYDDRFILNLAVAEEGIVVSNDQYRDLQMERQSYHEVSTKRLLQFTFVGDHFMPPEDPLGRDGPSLDQFLCHPDQPPSAQAAGRAVPMVPVMPRRRPVDTGSEIAAPEKPGMQRLLPFRSNQQTESLFIELIKIFPEPQQMSRVRAVLQNHKREIDLNRLSEYCVNAMPDT